MIFSLFGRVLDDPADHHPDLAILRRVTKAGDWQAVSAYFDGLAARADRSVAVQVVSGTPRVDDFLQRVVDTERESSLARTLLGARLIVLAWQARGGRLAQHVGKAQWKVFGERLRHAERVLAEATALDPANAAAWTERIATARGLSLGVAEARRRYEKAAEHCDVPFVAQSQLLQNLCPKWSGSLKEMYAFARACLAQATPGTLGGAIMAHAHVEHAFTNEYVHQFQEYMSSMLVAVQLREAAAQTVLHPQFQSCHGEVAAHTAFAYAFYTGWHKDAAQHFAALKGRSARYPWHTDNRDWQAAVRRARRAASKW